MRHRSEVLLIVAMSVFGLAGAFAWTVMRVQSSVPVVTVDPILPPAPGPANTVDARAWFDAVRPYCNPVDVDTRMRWQPAPDGDDSAAYRAACYALAGRVDSAREVIVALPDGRRWQAAGTVFEVGHPAADAGDELAAGPLMELVVEFWPNHYMALYHAGAAAYERGEHAKASDYLMRFMDEYEVEDGWKTSARGMLERISG